MRIQSDAGGAQTVLPVDPANTREMQQGAAWLRRQDAASAELAAAEAAHAPLAAGLQSLKDEQQKLAGKLIEDNRWTHSVQQRMQHSASGVEGPPPPFVPTTADRQLLAGMEAAGHPMAAAVREEITPPAVRQLQEKLGKATPGTPMSILDAVTGGTPGSGVRATAQEAAAARDLTLKSLGVSDPKNVTLTPQPDGTQALHWPRFGGTAAVAVYDPAQKSLTVKAENGTLSEGTRQMLQQLAVPPSRPGAKPPAEGMPVYFGNGPRTTQAELSALITAGKQAHETARTPEERAAALEKLGLSPAGVKKQWESGAISLQQALALNGVFNGVVEPNTTLAGTHGALQDWARDPKNAAMGAWFTDGTPEQRAYAINQYFKQTSPRAQGSLLATPERMDQLRRSVLSGFDPAWGKPGAPSPGSSTEDGPAGLDRIPLKGGGSAHIPHGHWTARDYETLDQHPDIRSLPHAEREAAVDTLLSDYHDQLTSQPGFSAADQQKFNQTAQALRDRVAALKTWGDTAGQGVDLVKDAAKSEVGTHVAAGADLSIFNPDGSLRVPGKNLMEQSTYEAQKAKDTAQRLAQPAAEKKMDDALEAIHQDIRNGSFPLAPGEAQDRWIDEISARLNPQRQQWFDAVQGPADPNTPEGKRHLKHLHEQTLASPENRALLQEYIRTGNKARWQELEHNLKKTPQRAQTEEDQQTSLRNDPLVRGLSDAAGTDLSEYMQGAPGAIAGHFVPGMDKFGRLGKLGKGSRVGRVVRRAAGVAADIGGTVAQNTIENPDAGFEDHKQAVIADYATSLGMKPLHHAAGVAGQTIKDHLPGRRPDPGSTGSPPTPSDGQTFDERVALEDGSMPLPRMDTAQPRQPGDATSQPPPASQQTIPETTTPTAPGSASAPPPQTPAPDRESAASTVTATPGAPQAPDSTSGPRLQFSQGGGKSRAEADSDIVDAHRLLSQEEDAFQLGKSKPDTSGMPLSGSLTELAKAYSPKGKELRVTQVGGIEPDSATSWYRVSTTNGDAYFYVDSEAKSLTLDTATLDSHSTKAGGGSNIYQLAQTFAKQNGLTFLPDRTVSAKAQRRRISQMISSVFRHGSTDHLNGNATFKDPYTDTIRTEVPGWKTGDHEHNTALLLRMELNHTLDQAAQIDKISKDKDLVERINQLTHDPKTNTIIDGRTGTALTQGALQSLVDRLEPGESGIGATTLLRSVVTRSALQRQDASGRVLPLRESGGGHPSGKEPRISDGDLVSVARHLYYSRPSGSTGGVPPRRMGDALSERPNGLASAVADVSDHLKTQVPGLLHDRTHVFHSVEDLLNSDYAKQHPFSKEDLAGLQNAEGFHDPKSGHSAIIAGNVELRPGETPHDALTRVILHERVGHDGLQTLLGSQDSKAQQHWQGLTQRIKPEELDAIARQDGYQHLAGNRNALAHEWFARQVEKSPHLLKQPGLVRDMWESFKGQLRKLSNNWKNTDDSHLDTHLHELMRLSRKAALRPNTAPSASRSGGTSTPATGRSTHTTSSIAAPPVGHGNLIPENTTHPEHLDLAMKRTENLEKIARKRPLNPHEQEIYANARSVRDRNASASSVKETPGIL